jgi:hypothetical protein
MKYELQDQIRDLDRRLSPVERALQQVRIRHAETPPRTFAIGIAAELIDANGKGEVGTLGDCRNGFGYPIWLGSQCLVWFDPVERMIVYSNASTIISGEYVSGTKTLVASYTGWSGANGGHFDDTDLDDTHFEIVDPDTVLPGASGGDRVFFLTGAGTTLPNKLTAVSADDVPGGGGGGTVVVDWPGDDPETGTTMGIVLKALVNESGDVASSDTTFDFDGATVAGGWGPSSGAPTSGTCNNCGHAFVNNETILVVGTGAAWQAVKLNLNVIRAKVNQAGGVETTDATFNFKDMVDITGTPTAVASPVADNDIGLEWEDDEEFIAFQRDDGDWQPLKIRQYFIRIKGEVVGAVGSGTTSFEIDSIAVIQGDRPHLNASSRIDVTKASGFALTNNQVIEARYNKSVPGWEMDVIHKEMKVLNPAGGHTLDASGTSLVLTLKTLDKVVAIPAELSSSAADLTITYADGVECE